MHWAHKKDSMQNKKLRADYLAQKREKDHKIIRGRVSAERAEAAYTKWLEKNHFNSLEPPQECKKRKQSIESPYLLKFVEAARLQAAEGTQDLHSNPDEPPSAREELGFGWQA